ncbi:glycoside hydrolase [Clavulina sp. PMI_390]|nr:glycoside hydrolase [Clavulina sp. PMI_390]
MKVHSLSLGALVAVNTVAAFTPRSWDDATVLATALAHQLTTQEKLTLVRGVGEFSSVCTGNLPAIPRLNIPSICMNDGPAGMRSVDLVSGFPAGITAAATWNRALIRARGQAIGEEFRTKGAHVFLGPAMDVMRAPEAGRLWESFGADGYLTGEAAYETIVGVQSTGVQAIAKHALLNNQEAYRYTENSVADERTLMEKYWLPFGRAIAANVSGVMCSYNRVNSSYACVNPSIIGVHGLLKGYGGHRGYVVSDWGATHGDAGTLANAGLDIEMPGDWILIGGGVYAGGLAGAISSGQVSSARLDEMIIRAYTPYYMLGQDAGFPVTNYNVETSSGNQHVNARSAAHTKLIKDIASAGTVLLKNINNALPLDTGNPPRTLAIVGQDAINQTSCELNACDYGTLSVGWGSGTNSLAFLIPPIDAIKSFLAASGSKTQLIMSLTDNDSAAIAAARNAETAIVFVNADSGEFQPILVNWSTGDRTNNNLWNYGDNLIKAVAGVCKNTIVVMHVVGPTLVDAWVDHPNVTAVLMAGLPGEQSGPSIVDVLYGNVNPSGRLPYTIAKKSSDWPTHTVELTLALDPTIKYTEGLFTDYAYFDANSIQPRFEFGFGLSYDFRTSYSNLQVVPGQGANSYTITVQVTNLGGRTGTEIAQLYLGFPSGSGEPPKLLRGFEAVALDVGQTSTVSFLLETKDISVWDSVLGAMVRPSGTFTVYIGSSSRNIAMITTF